MCSKDKELSISSLHKQIRSELNSAPEVFFTAHKRYLSHNIASFLPQDFLKTGKFSKEDMFNFIENKFWQEFTARHSELKSLFPVFHSLIEDDNPELCGFQLHSILGRGSDSVVYQTSDGYALKVVPAGKSEKLQMEFSILKRISHRNIVNVFEFWQNSNGAGMLMELLTPRLSDYEDYFAGVKAIHSSGYLHGDIRKSNMGIDKNGNGKIFDLGNALPLAIDKAKKEIENLKILFEQTILPSNLQPDVSM